MISILKKLSYYSEHFFCIISANLFLLGSTNKYDNYTLPLSIASTMFMIGVWIIQGRSLKIPKNFLLYAIFLASLFIHTFFFDGNMTYVVLFISGGFYWLIFNNFKKINFHKIYFPSLVVFGFLMVTLYLVFLTLGVTTWENNSLFLPLYKTTLHNHLGDLWAVILVGVIYSISEENRTWQIPLIIFGVLIMLQSFSRSATVSLIAGSAYIYHRLGNQEKLDKYLKYILAAVVIMFIVTGVFKTTIFSRPYIGEAFNAVLSSPLGIGVGRFGDVSSNSSVAHNLILEFVSGMGIFSIVFLIWIYKVYKSIVTSKTNTLFLAIFIAILTNFLFDTTYTIPTMIWLMFSSFALVFTNKS